MDRDSIMHASFGAHFGFPAEEYLLALVGRVVGVGAGGAEVVVGDGFQDVGGAEFGRSAFTAEGGMVR